VRLDGKWDEEADNGHEEGIATLHNMLATF
jgi:hypothetical protein